MLYPVSNLNSASNFLKSSKLPLFKANSATSTKSLERTPDVDTLDKHKRKKSKRRVALLVGVYVALMSIQCVPLYKLYRKRQISIKEIEKKFPRRNV